jgi:Contractile injection system tape measure protein
MKFSKKAHSVKRFSLEVEYPEEKTAKAAQEKVLYIAKNKLANILDDACIRYSSDLLVKVKNITLDLGDIPASELERRLPQLFEKKIHQLLSGFKSKVYSQKGLQGVEVIDQEQQILLYFTYYLKYGTIPWYLQDVVGEYTFSEVFAYLIEKNDDSFKEEFYNLLEYSNVRRRLARYFDTGEIMQIFKSSMPDSLHSNIHFLYKEINQIILVSQNIEGAHKDYLRMYLKEFLLIASAGFKHSNESYSLESLTKKFIDFVASEKNISTEKWLPSILSYYSRTVRVESEKETIFHALQDSYIEYLSEEKVEITPSESEKPVEKKQFYDWLKDKQPVSSKDLIKAIEDIIKQIEKRYPSIQKSKLEQIVWRVSYNILPEMLIDTGNVSKWVYAISRKAEEMFGISERVLKEEKKQKKTIEQKKEFKELDISIIRDYLSLFIKSSLKPFIKIYSDPAKELKPLFEKYMQEAEAKAFIKEQVEDDNLMVLWWVKEAFGDQFLSDFEKIAGVGRKTIFPKEIKYDYLILVSFFRTGVFPWVELIDKGKASLINTIEYFFTPEHRTKLTKLLLDEDFFKEKTVMGKVFETLPVNLGGELLKIRKDLVSKGTLTLKDQEVFEHVEERVSEEEEQKEILKRRLVDSLVNQIIEFSIETRPTSLSKKEQADLIFSEILKSTKRSFYETAAMIVSLDKKVVDALLLVFDSKQKDYVKKLVQNYRSRFVSIADEIKESEKREEQLMSMEGEAGETLYVNNAGIVLLNVYAKRLFDRFELLDKKEFKSDEAREKAIRILQYLVSKDNEPEEHELLLNKVLVGMPITAPLKFEIKITDEEKEICDGLLDAVIKNWTVLKNTSRDGLRTSFLLRNGSLKKEETAWQLRVEKKAYDVLLNKLPWGYTMIHFPWMKIPLLTEWEDQKT